MPRAFYLDVAEALRGFLPVRYRGFEQHAQGRNLKVWFESWHEHYEVQLIGRAPLRSASMRGTEGLEIGLHLEHPQPQRNEETLARLGTKWRRALGNNAVAGPFLGSPEHAKRWRRLSEIWTDGDLESDEAAIEGAERLAFYIKTIEPLRLATCASQEATRARAATRRRPSSRDRPDP